MHFRRKPNHLGTRYRSSVAIDAAVQPWTPCSTLARTCLSLPYMRCMYREHRARALCVTCPHPSAVMSTLARRRLMPAARLLPLSRGCRPHQDKDLPSLAPSRVRQRVLPGLRPMQMDVAATLVRRPHKRSSTAAEMAHLVVSLRQCQRTCTGRTPRCVAALTSQPCSTCSSPMHWCRWI